MNIQPISMSERNLGGIDYFLLWAGVAISLAEIWAGGFLAPMGFWAGLCAILIGHIIGNTLMGLGGMIGSEYGIMSMVSVRPAFGIRGSNLASVLNIIQLVGWSSIMLIIGGKAGATVGEHIGGGILADNRLWIITIGSGTLIWSLFMGQSVWKILQRIAVIGVLAILVLMSYVSLKEFGTGFSSVKVQDMPFMIGLDLVIAMPISWLPLVSDYSRFSKKNTTAFWNTWTGYFIVSCWMYVLGLSATIVTGTEEPNIQILQIMGKIGFAIPALIMVVFSTITADFPDVYSATCSMMNIAPKITSKNFMCITSIFSMLLALVFPVNQYENFLLFIGAMFIPLFGVVLADYFILRHRKLSIEQIYKQGGQYWYSGGFNISALTAWAAGFALYEWIAIMKYSIGGSIPSMVLAGIIYLFMTNYKNNNSLLNEEEQV